MILLTDATFFLMHFKKGKNEGMVVTLNMLHIGKLFKTSNFLTRTSETFPWFSLCDYVVVNINLSFVFLSTKEKL